MPRRAPRQTERGPDDPLRRLEEQLERASVAAERLVAEAASEAAAAAARLGERAAPPPSGWQVPRRPQAQDSERGGELERLIALVESLRELVPPDLRRRLAEALREVLLAVRALIDWYLERLESGDDEPPEVQDIPVV